MYIQITTKCNMNCDHCGFACSPDNGEHMNFDVFKQAISFCDENVCIGGGEPTVHPQFEKFFLYAMSYCDYVYIITNGKNKDRALMLANLADRRSGVVYAQLSLDPYHESIDEEVVKAFTKRKMIRNTSEYLVNAGRCDFGHSDECFCPEPIVQPSGVIKHCGCLDSPVVGNVMDGGYYTQYPECDCYKTLKNDLVESL